MSFETPGLIERDHNSEKWHALTVDIGEAPIRFEVGRIAKQAAGSVWVSRGGSTVLVTVCASDKPREGIDFFPLTVEYVEKTYAAGRIPGGFFKREARPRDHEVLNARITDRSIRPLFPDGFRNEVQVIATVVSHDGENETDTLALCGASMALHVSNIPWAENSGPLAGVRVGRIDGKLVANPSVSQRNKSDLDVVVAASKDAIVMVEGGATECSEDDLIEALYFAQEEGKKVIAACHEMREKMGKEKVVFTPPSRDEELFELVKKTSFDCGLREALGTKEKKARYAGLDKCKDDTLAKLQETLGEESFAAKKKDIGNYYGDVKYEVMRGDALTKKVRLDGRKYEEIRPIQCEVGALARSHGSALFTRGETQAVVAATLGTREDEQKIDGLLGESWRRFMLHYNFPPFSVGEARMLRSTSRREIGHGALAERAIAYMVPSQEEFPYTIRLVSEITESNGSSSMASVCGGTMALYDAGVPLKQPVAGIAMGLIAQGKDYAVL
ncbi:MAG: polyribonucleotide nucleotidyltransferase, partial [Myxococcota bacterium]